MTTLKESSLAYVPQTTNNITELEAVDVNNEIKSSSFMMKEKDKDGIEQEKEVKYEYIEVAGNEFRIPQSVKKQLKAQLEANPDLQYFKVTKDGTGLNTAYTVIPLLTKLPSMLTVNKNAS